MVLCDKLKQSQKKKMSSAERFYTRALVSPPIFIGEQLNSSHTWLTDHAHNNTHHSLSLVRCQTRSSTRCVHHKCLDGIQLYTLLFFFLFNYLKLFFLIFFKMRDNKMPWVEMKSLSLRRNPWNRGFPSINLVIFFYFTS